MRILALIERAFFGITMIGNGGVAMQFVNARTGEVIEIRLDQGGYGYCALGHVRLMAVLVPATAGQPEQAVPTGEPVPGADYRIETGTGAMPDLYRLVEAPVSGERTSGAPARTSA
jgi:hypothetical protein